MGYFLQFEYLLRHLQRQPDDIPLVVVMALRVLLVVGVFVFVFRKYFTFIVKSLGRNLLRTALTSGAIMILVFVVTLIWSFLVVLDVIMTEKSKDLKAIVTERWQIPSQMPFQYANRLEEGAPQKPGDVRVRPQDSMTWQFYGGSIDPSKMTRENSLFFFAMDPRKIRAMMDDLDLIDPALPQKMVENKQGVLIGREKLEAMNKRVGERIRVTSMNYKGIDLDFDIVGELPEGRYNMSGIMNRDYLNDALDGYQRDHGEKHPLADKSLNLVWLRVPDSRAFQQVADQIMRSSEFTAPAVKCETASSGIASWLEPYQDLLNGLKFLLVPTILVIMTMVIAIAISISIRERRAELAVLKVLGFSPTRILLLVLGEALLIGGGSGLLSGTLSYVVVHHCMGGIKFPVAFFPVFDIYADAIWWGLLFGTVTAFLGSVSSAWSARTIKVSEVFSKVA
jgi:putative ABC transport system permease protein